ncbi:MAG: hypothetical protein QNJ55_14755 [Xenococcus sp. MO_188.B8]|nr:hypothetical protein [Xenococcus sp. MO_188.B8]
MTFNTNESKEQLSSQSFLHDFFVNLYQDLKKHQSGFEVLVILIDDIENCLAIPEILVLLKSTFSMESVKKCKIILGLASPTLDWLELTSVRDRPQKHHPLTRFFFSQIKLHELSQEEVSTIAKNSLRGTGVSFSSEIIKLIFDYTNGHPFEMQSLCSHLFNNQLSGRVDIDIWDKALQDTLNDMGS